jgi:hypothetical protein
MADEIKREFESETCSRCGGSGNYSYCQMYGPTCFKCRGRKKILSKRGQAASDYLRDLRTVKVADIQAGWLIWLPPDVFGTYKSSWYEVLSFVLNTGDFATARSNDIETRSEYSKIETRVMSQMTFPESTVMAVPNKERLAETRELALDYQETLTKSGTVAKVCNVAA